MPEKEKNTKQTKQNGVTPAKTKKLPSSGIKHADQMSNHSHASLAVGGSMKKLLFYIRGQELSFSVFEDMSQADWDALIKQIQNIKLFSK